MMSRAVGIAIVGLALSGCDEHCDPAKIDIGFVEAQVIAACGKPTSRNGGSTTWWKDAHGTKAVVSPVYLAYNHINGSYDLIVLADGKTVDHASRNPPLEK